MQSKKHTPEQIIAKLRQAEVELAKGLTIPQAARKLGITEQTYYRWRKKSGGIRIDQAKQLKKVVADLTLDNAILKEATYPNC